MKLTHQQLKDAVNYNGSRVVSQEQLAVLVGQWQDSHGLSVDGKYGPNTSRSVLDEVSLIQPPKSISLPEMAVRVAVELIGKGEEGGNNKGQFLKDISIDGRDGHMWCALFATY